VPGGIAAVQIAPRPVPLIRNLRGGVESSPIGANSNKVMLRYLFRIHVRFALLAVLASGIFAPAEAQSTPPARKSSACQAVHIGKAGYAPRWLAWFPHLQPEYDGALSSLHHNAMQASTFSPFHPHSDDVFSLVFLAEGSQAIKPIPSSIDLPLLSDHQLHQVVRKRASAAGALIGRSKQLDRPWRDAVSPGFLKTAQRHVTEIPKPPNCKEKQNNVVRI
jgi:hypothetical protein